MTVSSSTNRVSYSGNGTLTVFAYTFKVFDESDLTVILRASDGTETVQTITTHYTVSGVGDVGGGNITFVTAPTATQTVVILREQPLTQGLDLVPNDPFPAESLEESFDKLTFMVQQHEEELGRAIKASRTNTITTTEFVESASDRANKVIAFDGSGDLDLTQEIGTFQGNWAASTAYAVRDIVKDTNNNNIYIANTAHTSSGTVPLTGNADIAKWDLLVDAAAATTSANNAATSATAAATSATAAATSATAAATSESNAATSASNASTSETNAAASATNAATSESNAAGSESAAATSETNAATSATSASTSASAAATSATNAATSETAAAASQSAAATSATAAATSATSAATNATNAATSATNASTAQTAAETAQTAAEAAQAAAELAADNFDDTYLGSKSSDPTVDNDGGALNAGDLYFNTTANELRVYSGSAWQAAALDASGYITTSGGSITGNLSVSGDLTVDTNTLYVDSTNNRIGIGVAPSTKLHVKNGTNQNFNVFGPAVFSNGVTIASTTDGFTGYLEMEQRATQFAWHNGTTERMRIDSSGNVGIGTSSPQQQSGIGLHINNSSGQSRVKLTSSTTGATANDGFDIIVESEIGSPVHLLQHEAGPLKFGTSNTERMRIDSSGNLLVGKTAIGSNTVGFQVASSGKIAATVSGDETARFNRTTSDGDIVEFRKDDTPVGSIASRAGVVSSIILDPRSGGGGLTGGGAALYPIDNAGTPNDGVLTLGDAGNRFLNLYLSGGVYLGGTGAANKLDDYEEGTFSPTVGLDVGSGTFSTWGSYVKIGKQVTVTIRINIDTASSALMNVIGNMPFTPENLNQQAVGSVRENASTGYQWHLRATGNNTSFLLRRYDNDQAISAGYQFIGSVTYFTA